MKIVVFLFILYETNMSAISKNLAHIFFFFFILKRFIFFIFLYLIYHWLRCHNYPIKGQKVSFFIDGHSTAAVGNMWAACLVSRLCRVLIWDAFEAWRNGKVYVTFPEAFLQEPSETLWLLSSHTPLPLILCSSPLLSCSIPPGNLVGVSLGRRSVKCKTRFQKQQPGTQSDTVLICCTARMGPQANSLCANESQQLSFLFNVLRNLRQDTKGE